MMTNVFHNKELERLQVLDSRFYSDGEGNYYPSVTTILQVYPKGFGFEQWLKDVGQNAVTIMDRAAADGTAVHEATERLNNGEQVNWCDSEGKALYTVEQWRMINRFVDFWQQVKPTLLANELSLCNAKLGYGGTLDRIVTINKKNYLIDIKTSNNLHTSHELQLAAYAVLWNESNKERPIHETAILWLKSTNRTAKIDVEKDIFQGHTDAGAWQLKTFDRHYLEAYELFKHTFALWKEENPNHKPLNKIYSDKLKL